MCQVSSYSCWRKAEGKADGAEGFGDSRLLWNEVAAALQQNKFLGYAVIEFCDPGGRFAHFVSFWRAYAASSDILVQKGLTFLWKPLHC